MIKVDEKLWSDLKIAKESNKVSFTIKKTFFFINKSFCNKQ